MYQCSTSLSGPSELVEADPCRSAPVQACEDSPELPHPAAPGSTVKWRPDQGRPWGWQTRAYPRLPGQYQGRARLRIRPRGAVCIVSASAGVCSARPSANRQCLSFSSRMVRSSSCVLMYSFILVHTRSCQAQKRPTRVGEASCDLRASSAVASRDGTVARCRVSRVATRDAGLVKPMQNATCVETHQVPDLRKFQILGSVAPAGPRKARGPSEAELWQAECW